MSSISRRYFLFLIITTVFGFVLLFLNIQYPSYIEEIYQNENIDQLNQWVGSDQEELLGYYIGRIEDKFIGPLTNVVMHVLFAFFCLLYLSKASSKKFFISVFIFLIITKFNVLFYPLYGDAIGGPFAEGIWLANHDFDYAGLLNQPSYNLGGPRVYFFSLYPTYLAILLKLFPWTQVFLVVNHLIVYLLSAGIISFVRTIVAKRFDSVTAMMTAIIVLALPIFQSQTEAINMEIPCLFFSIISIYCLIQKNIGKACMFAILSLMIKGHGIIPCGTVAVVSLFLFLFDQHKRKKRILCYGFLSALAVVLMAGSKFLLKDQHAVGGMMGFLNGLPSLKIMYLPQLYFISLGVFIFGLVWKEKGFMRSLQDKYYPQLVVFIAAAMWFVLFVNYTEVSPRSKLALAPYLVLCILFSILTFFKIKKVIHVFLILVVGVVALGSYGFYHFPLKPNYHIFSERSLEYRNDLKVNQKLVKEIEEKYSNFTIGAPFLTAQILRMPQLGYVKKPLDVVIYGMPSTYGGLRNFDGLKNMNIRKTVWVGVAAQFEKHGVFQYPIHSKDHILKGFALGENRLSLFMGGIAIEQRRQMVEAFQRRK